MKSKIAGVALAAVVGACAVGGVARQAEASSLSFSFSYEQDYSSYSVATYASGIIDLSHDLAKYSVYVDYASSDPGVPDMDKRYDIFTSGGTAYIGSVDTTYGLANYYGYGDSYLNFYKQDFQSDYATTVFSPSTSIFLPSGGITVDVALGNQFLVPLPSSAALFGAALLALGGGSYTSRRRGRQITKAVTLMA